MAPENADRPKNVTVSELCDPADELLEFQRSAYCETSRSGLDVDAVWGEVIHPSYEDVTKGIARFINKLPICAKKI